MRLARAAILAFTAAAASAQPPSVAGPSIAAQETARARLLLHSESWRDKAWGVYLAGRLASPDLAPDLIQQFRSAAAIANESRSSEQWAFVAALFDAAIQSGLQVSTDALEPYVDHWSDPVLVLLANSRDRDRQALLLRLADSHYDLFWVAANNLLLGMKSQAWYVQTWNSVRVTHLFTVVDPDAAAGGEGGIATGSCGDGILEVPKSFPPIGFYSLEANPKPGMTLTAPGPANVYYRRTVVPTGGRSGFGSCFSVDRQDMRIQYLAALAQMPADQARQLFRVATLIRYQGAEAFAREVKSSLDAQEQAIRGIVATIQTRERLSAHGAALRIEPELRDSRHSASEPLPPIPPRDLEFN